METLWRDVRHTLRWMARQKGFTATACLTLALGIGANTAIFSVVYGVLLRPLPYDHPEQLVHVAEEHPGAQSPLRGAYLSNVTFESWTRAMHTLEDVAAYGEETFTVGREDPQRLPGATVSPSLFSLLRVAPAVGRFFVPEEAVEGAPGAVVLSHELWQARFGGDPAAIGRTIFIDGRPCRVVGVAPRGFAFPSPEAELWMPYVIPRVASLPKGGISTFSALGRLKPGVTAAQAEAEGTAAARAVPRPMAADLLFGKGKPVEVRVRPVVEEQTAGVRPALLVLAVGVGLVLLIACANVSNLFLSRALARQRDLAVRAALGAGRGRLARQILTESVVLSLGGGVLGILFAAGLTRAVPALAPENLPRIGEIHLDGWVLAFAGCASILAGLLSGLVPAWRGMHTGAATVLHDGGSRATSAAGKSLRSGLLVAEAALAVVLLIGAALLARSFVRLLEIDSGFVPDNVLIAQVILPNDPDEERAAAHSDAFVKALQTRLEALPGVVSAGISNMAPLGDSTAVMGFALPTGSGEPASVLANLWVVTPGYERALGLRIRSGRFLAAADLTSGTLALVVNEELARRYLADGKPVIGRRYPGLLYGSERVTEIVGVVGNVLKDGPDRPPQPEIYVVPSDRNRGMLTEPYVLVRTTGDPLALAPAFRRLVREMEPQAAVDGVGRLTSRASRAVAQPRFAAIVLGVFALLALALAATGLYGVLTYGVSQRRREMGIRAALGATRAGLSRLILREGLVLTAAGLVLGLAVAAAVMRLMASLLFGVTPFDLLAYTTAPLALLGVAAVACLLPARRAAAADPAEALRSE